VGLTLKGHGRDRTLKGLRGNMRAHASRPIAGAPDPLGSVACHGPVGPGRVSQSWGAPNHASCIAAPLSSIRVHRHRSLGEAPPPPFFSKWLQPRRLRPHDATMYAADRGERSETVAYDGFRRSALGGLPRKPAFVPAPEGVGDQTRGMRRGA